MKKAPKRICAAMKIEHARAQLLCDEWWSTTPSTVPAEGRVEGEDLRVFTLEAPLVTCRACREKMTVA